MKDINTKSIITIIIFLISLNFLSGKDSAILKRYQIKSGIIEYQLTGSKSGIQTVYFDNWGSSEAKYINVTNKMMGVTQNENRLELIQSEWSYSVNLDDKKGVKVNNQMKEFAKKYKTDNLEKVGEEIFKSLGGTKTGTEKILGRQCTVWELKQIGTKIWVWKGINLKTHSKLQGIEYTSVATKIQENASIPADKLMLPQGAKITDMPMNIGEKKKQK